MASIVCAVNESKLLFLMRLVLCNLYANVAPLLVAAAGGMNEGLKGHVIVPYKPHSLTLFIVESGGHVVHNR